MIRCGNIIAFNNTIVYFEVLFFFNIYKNQITLFCAICWVTGIEAEKKTQLILIIHLVCWIDTLLCRFFFLLPTVKLQTIYKITFPFTFSYSCVCTTKLYIHNNCYSFLFIIIVLCFIRHYTRAVFYLFNFFTV